jgi:hypothetical protein
LEFIINNLNLNNFSKHYHLPLPLPLPPLPPAVLPPLPPSRSSRPNQPLLNLLPYDLILLPTPRIVPALFIFLPALSELSPLGPIVLGQLRLLLVLGLAHLLEAQMSGLLPFLVGDTAFLVF